MLERLGELWANVEVLSREGDTPRFRRTLCWYYALSRAVGTEMWRGILVHGCHDPVLQSLVLGVGVREAARAALVRLRESGDLEALAMLILAESIYGGVIDMVERADVLAVIREHGADYVRMMFGLYDRMPTQNELLDMPYLLVGGLRGAQRWARLL